jgi:hypothetical protein
MAFGQTPKDSAGLPVGSVYVPNVGFVGLQGSPVNNTDGLSNASAGVVSVDQIASAIINSKGFVATTGTLVTATNGNLTMGMSVFNPSGSGKNLYIYSIKYHAFNISAAPKYNITTADPLYSNAITPQNLRPAGGASVANVTSAANNASASISLSGTLQDLTAVNAAGTVEFLPSSSGIMFPAGSANGITVYGIVTTAGGSWGATVRWIEF